MKEILHVGALRQGRFVELSTGQAPSLQPEMEGSSGSAEPLRTPVPQAASEGVNAASRPCLLPKVRFWSSPSVVPVSGDGCWPQSSPAGPAGRASGAAAGAYGLQLPGRRPLRKSQVPRGPWEVSKQNLRVSLKKEYSIPPGVAECPSPRNCWAN